MDIQPDIQPDNASKQAPPQGGASIVPDASKSKPFAMPNLKQTRSHLANFEANTYGAWEEAKKHPLTTALDILGAPGRAVEGAGEALHEHQGLHDALKTVSDNVWHPNPKRVIKAREGFQRGLHISTDSDIDTMVSNFNRVHLPGAKVGVFGGDAAPYVKNALKTVNNVATDTISDPFAIGGDISTGVRDLRNAGFVSHIPNVLHNPLTKPLVQNGAQTSRIIASHVYNLLNNHGAGKSFAHLKGAVAATKNMGDGIHKVLQDTFETRPDLLHIGLTKDGRDARIQLENAQRVLKHKDAQADEEVLNDSDKAVQRYAQYVHQHGSAKRSANAASILPQHMQSSTAPTGHLSKSYTTQQIRAMSPDERADMFRDVRKEIHHNQLAKNTEQIFNTPGGKALTKGGTKIDWDKYRQPDDQFKIKKFDISNKMSDIGRMGIELNPLPHGGTNVGTLAYLGGGLDAVTRGISAMHNPIPSHIKDRLNAMGAGAPEYINSKNSINIPLPGYKEVRQGMNHVLEQMEHGWRAGMLEHLDHALGPTVPGSKEELLKGALINKKLGDYRNVSAFAKFFSSIGGPFVAYHLGILPKAVIDSIKSNPIRFETAARTQQELQDNREGARRDTMTISNPVQQASKGVVDPVDYVFTGSTLGVAKDAYDNWMDWNNPSEQHKTLDQGLAGIAMSHLAPLGLVQGVEDQIHNKTLGGQPMSFADHIATTMLGALNAHIHRNGSDKTVRKNQKYIRKHGFDYGDE